MKARVFVSLAAIAATAGCTSVRVDRHVPEKYEKVPEAKVEQTSTDYVSAHPHENLATVQLSTKGRFASSLTKRARRITSKLGGDAYLVTASDTSTRVTGSLIGTLADETVASMTFDVLRWKTAPPPPASSTKRRQSTPAPTAPQPAKKKPWYWPF